MRDVDVDTDRVGARGVRGDDVRGPAHSSTAAGHDLFDEPELGKVADQRSDGGAAQMEPLGELRTRQRPVAVHVTEQQRPVVLPDLVWAYCT